MRDRRRLAADPRTRPGAGHGKRRSRRDGRARHHEKGPPGNAAHCAREARRRRCPGSPALPRNHYPRYPSPRRTALRPRSHLYPRRDRLWTHPNQGSRDQRHARIRRLPPCRARTRRPAEGRHRSSAACLPRGKGERSRMTRDAILQMLEDVRTGELSTTDALSQLAKLPYEDAGYAKIDHHRSLRLGLPEVIYAAGKTPQQVAGIFERMASAGGDVIATRASAEAFAAVRAVAPQAEYHEVARGIGLRRQSAANPAGPIAVVCAGTSDLPVAEEAAV